jgi:hypothetical protein
MFYFLYLINRYFFMETNKNVKKVIPILEGDIERDRLQMWGVHGYSPMCPVPKLSISLD